jgi:hypothetical protein
MFWNLMIIFLKEFLKILAQVELKLKEKSA